jgi:hypothetical protein
MLRPLLRPFAKKASVNQCLLRRYDLKGGSIYPDIPVPLLLVILIVILISPSQNRPRLSKRKLPLFAIQKVKVPFTQQLDTC